MNKHITWRILDALVTSLMIGATAHFGNGWLAVAVTSNA